MPLVHFEVELDNGARYVAGLNLRVDDPDDGVQVLGVEETFPAGCPEEGLPAVLDRLVGRLASASLDPGDPDLLETVLREQTEDARWASLRS